MEGGRWPKRTSEAVNVYSCLMLVTSSGAIIYSRSIKLNYYRLELLFWVVKVIIVFNSKVGGCVELLLSNTFYDYHDIGSYHPMRKLCVGFHHWHTHNLIIVLYTVSFRRKFYHCMKVSLTNCLPACLSVSCLPWLSSHVRVTAFRYITI